MPSSIAKCHYQFMGKRRFEIKILRMQGCDEGSENVVWLIGREEGKYEVIAGEVWREVYRVCIAYLNIRDEISEKVWKGNRKIGAIRRVSRTRVIELRCRQLSLSCPAELC